MRTLLNLIGFWVTNLLGLWAHGPLGYIGIAKEATWGTPVAPTDYFEAMSESLTESIERFPVRNIVNLLSEPDDYAGARRIAGDISMFGHPVSLGHLLKAALNTISGSVVLSGFLWRNNFISTKSEWVDGAGVIVPSQGYTIEVHRDVTSAYQHAGAVCNQLQLALTGNGDLRATAGWIAKGSLLVAKSTPTFPGSPTDPFTFDTASVSIGGSATARLEAFNLRISNGLAGYLALNNSNQVARIRRDSEQQIRISGTLDFPDVTEYLDFRNQTERQFQLNLFRSQSFNILIDLPRMVYTAMPLGNPGRGRLTLAFDGVGRYSTTSGVAISVGLTTIKSNY